MHLHVTLLAVQAETMSRLVLAAIEADYECMWTKLIVFIFTCITLLNQDDLKYLQGLEEKMTGIKSGSYPILILLQLHFRFHFGFCLLQYRFLDII